MIKNIITIFIKNENLSLLLSDFSHDWDFSIQWKSIQISSMITLLLIQLNTFLCHKNNEIKPFISRTESVEKIEIQAIKYHNIINNTVFIISIIFSSEFCFLSLNYCFQMNFVYFGR